MQIEAELVLDAKCTLGEGPRWNADEGALYFVDIIGARFHRYAPDTTLLETFEVGAMLGALAFRANGGLMLATSRGIATWTREAGVNFMVNPEADKPDNRFNDGEVDPAGRFWAGTMAKNPGAFAEPQGSLYRLDSDGTLTKQETGLWVSNGIGWSPDRRTMYLADSDPRKIYAYDYELASGSISNRRVFVDAEGAGVPDGLAVDSEGFIWSARWDGWRICRYAPDGKLDLELNLPVARVTACAFGGANLDELYITTAREGLSAEQLAAQPLAGGLFRAKVGVKGQPVNFYKG
jgi:sugar lactone lactonase YvrE